MSFNFAAHELTIEADVRAEEGRVAESASRGLGLNTLFVYIRCCDHQGEEWVRRAFLRFRGGPLLLRERAAQRTAFS